jgi:EAL domain-containing protein (putative c-di-GMP-specific phosphodiesterase class I)
VQWTIGGILSNSTAMSKSRSIYRFRICKMRSRSKCLCRTLPDHPAFAGLIVEINGTEVIGNLKLVKDVARALRFHNIAISIDDLGAEWPSLMEVHDFPFVEIKVDRKFVNGCADDRLMQTVCRRILEGGFSNDT